MYWAWVINILNTVTVVALGLFQYLNEEKIDTHEKIYNTFCLAMLVIVSVLLHWAYHK